MHGTRGAAPLRCGRTGHSTAHMGLRASSDELMSERDRATKEAATDTTYAIAPVRLSRSGGSGAPFSLSLTLTARI
jgi:hypothetical protein